MKININLTLSITAAVMLLIVFYRTNKINLGFVVNTVPILAALVLFAWINFKIGGNTNVQKGFTIGHAMTIGFVPILIVMFLTMGQAMVLLAHYKEFIKTFLAGAYGLHGTLAASAIMPGSITGLPIVKEMWYEGISRPCLLVFLLTSPLINWQMFFFKLPMLGWKLTIIQSLFSIGNALMVVVIFRGWTYFTAR